MVETLHKEPVYSNERIETTKVGSPAEIANPAQSQEAELPSGAPKEMPKTPMASFLDAARIRGNPSFVDFTKFLNQTKGIWLTVVAGIFGLVVLFTLVGRLSQWARNTRERRHERAIASVTPERLIARCGEPAQDVTKDIYPILMRTITYQPDSDQKLVLSFSRTAEEQSDWVFLSMRDENGAKSYETPEAKVAAMPCLDSTK